MTTQLFTPVAKKLNLLDFPPKIYEFTNITEGTVVFACKYSVYSLPKVVKLMRISKMATIQSKAIEAEG